MHTGVLIIVDETDDIKEARSIAEGLLYNEEFTNEYWSIEAERLGIVEDTDEYEEFWDNATDLWDYAYHLVETWGGDNGVRINGVMRLGELREKVLPLGLHHFFSYAIYCDEPYYDEQILVEDNNISNNAYVFIGEVHV